MEPAVSTVLADSRLTAWDVLEDRWISGLPTELEDRFLGRRRSPQQAESLTAAGDGIRLYLDLEPLAFEH